jgi:putative toxin-antitoxin system antitoxin component (TIGR02293 family)
MTKNPDTSSVKKEKSALVRRKGAVRSIKTGGKVFTWSTNLERVRIIRSGIPYTSLEVISAELNRPVKAILELVGMPQTTYNKKKKEGSNLNAGDSELIVLITELLTVGVEVFNGEKEKFQRWFAKPNAALGGNTPESLIDTKTGIDEVMRCLHRIEYGNLA